MSQLRRRSDQKILIPQLRIARTLRARTRGLLGTSSLPADEALWIHRCNSIHTFFMRYPIDCVFLDRDLVVRSLVEHVKPGRIVWPQWRAWSVVEMKSGRIQELGIRKGEKLDVGD